MSIFHETLWWPIKILPPTTSPRPKLCFCTFRRKNCLLLRDSSREFQNCYEICKVCGGLKIERKIKRWTSSTSRLKISFHLKVKASPARYLMMIASHDRDRWVKIRENRNHARSANDHDERANTLSARFSRPCIVLMLMSLFLTSPQRSRFKSRAAAATAALALKN